MSAMHMFLDLDRRASLAQDVSHLTPEQAMAALRAAQAAHPAMRNRPAPKPDPLDRSVLTNCTSLQPLGGSQVLVCYDETEFGIDVTGVDLPDGFVEAADFAPHIVARWERDIADEIRRGALL